MADYRWAAVRRELRAIAPDGGWAVTGSAAMRLAGLRVAPGDIDVFMRPWVYDRALERGWEETWPTPGDPPMLVFHGGELEVNAWARWQHRTGWGIKEPTVAEVIDGARRVRNFWWIMDLRLLAEWKYALLTREETRNRHEKDQAHLRILTAAGYWPRVPDPATLRRDAT